MTKIICDTRQKRGKHENIDRWFRNHGVEYEYKKLDAGDYATSDGWSNILVDTKKGLAEICGNCGRDHDRVVREIHRASDNGYRLVFLIETTGNFHCIDDVASWTNDVCKRCGEYRMRACDPSRDRCGRFKRKPMTGKTLAKVMRGMERDHGCYFEFVHPVVAAKRICEILGVPYGR